MDDPTWHCQKWKKAMKQQNVEIGHNAKRAANTALDTISHHDEDCNNNKELEHEWLDCIKAVT